MDFTFVFICKIFKWAVVLYALPRNAFWNSKFPCAIFHIFGCNRDEIQNYHWIQHFGGFFQQNKNCTIDLLLVHIVGWKISTGGVNIICVFSKCNSSMVRPAAIAAPTQAGNCVCGRSIRRPHKSANNCSRNAFSLKSPPTVRRSIGFHVGTSLTSASIRSRVWKQIASYAANIIWYAVVRLFNPNSNLKNEEKRSLNPRSIRFEMFFNFSFTRLHYASNMVHIIRLMLAQIQHLCLDLACQWQLMFRDLSPNCMWTVSMIHPHRFVLVTHHLR